MAGQAQLASSAVSWRRKKLLQSIWSGASPPLRELRVPRPLLVAACYCSESGLVVVRGEIEKGKIKEI
jgi:hypothetical protein